MSKDLGLILKRFGKYLLLDHFVDGGMAKICRARFLGEEADKIVAIKMIQSQYSSDEAFKNMFLDEIKVTFGLIHPNITQTSDYGMEDGQLYQVMEYVNGRNLKEYLDKLKKRGYVFPVEVSVYIIAQVCQGLHYAHTFRNQLTGENAHIVHRDISPHNIMLTYDGAVKIIDFGIAKAASNSDKTQAGTIKGKLSYLAPEYLDGAELDARYDQFALGITLWEMLCSRKLFSAKNDMAVLKKIQSCKIPPPSSINPNVPKILDQIVLKALSKDRELRYENLDQLNRALIKFLYAKYPEFNATDLACFAKELFKDVIKQDHARFKDFGKVNISPFIAELKKGTPVASKNQIYDDDVIIIEDDADDDQFDDDVVETTAIRSATRRSVLNLDVNETESMPSLEMEQTKTKNDYSELLKNKRDIGTKKKRKVKMEETSRVTRIKNKGSTSHLAKTRSVNNSSSTYNTPKKRSGGLAKLLVAGLCMGVAWFGYEYYLEKELNKSKVDPIVKSKTSKILAKRSVASVGTIRLGNFANFDKLSYKLYVDGVLFKKMKDVLYGDIENLKIPASEEVVIRVVYDNQHAYFIQKVKFIDGVARVDVPAVEHMPLQKYGYLIGGGSCNARGNVTFSMFGEKRTERLPVKVRGGGIEFKIGKQEIRYIPDENPEIHLEYEELNLNLEFVKADDQIDVCNEIVKVLERLSDKP